MIRVTAKRDMRFTGYGLRFVAGVPHVVEKVPYGLRKSLERHARVGHVTVDWDPPAEAPQSPATVVSEPTAPPVPTAPEAPAVAPAEPAIDPQIAASEAPQEEPAQVPEAPQSEAPPVPASPPRRRRRRR